MKLSSHLSTLPLSLPLADLSDHQINFYIELAIVSLLVLMAGVVIKVGPKGLQGSLAAKAHMPLVCVLYSFEITGHAHVLFYQPKWHETLNLKLDFLASLIGLLLQPGAKEIFFFFPHLWFWILSFRPQMYALLYKTKQSIPCVFHTYVVFELAMQLRFLACNRPKGRSLFVVVATGVCVYTHKHLVRDAGRWLVRLCTRENSHYPILRLSIGNA